MLSGRLKLLGTEPWVPDPKNVTQEEIQEQLAKLCRDTSATAPTGMAPALHMVSAYHLLYAADCGVPCSTESTIEANRKAVLEYEGLLKGQRDAIGRKSFRYSMRLRSDWKSIDNRRNKLAYKALQVSRPV